MVHEFFHVMRRDRSQPTWHVLEDRINQDIRAQKDVHYERGQWPVEKEEYLARMWEKYLATGEAPSNPIKKIFNKLEMALRQIYGIVKGKSGDELPPLSPLDKLRCGKKMVKDDAGQKRKLGLWEAGGFDKWRQEHESAQERLYGEAWPLLKACVEE